MKKEKEIRKIAKAIEEAHCAENKSLSVMFKEDGSFTGEVLPCNAGYSESDRERNGDLLFCELNDENSERAIANFEAACDRLNGKQLPFGRGKKYFTDFRWHDFLVSEEDK